MTSGIIGPNPGDPGANFPTLQDPYGTEGSSTVNSNRPIPGMPNLEDLLRYSATTKVLGGPKGWHTDKEIAAEMERMRRDMYNDSKIPVPPFPEPGTYPGDIYTGPLPEDNPETGPRSKESGKLGLPDYIEIAYDVLRGGVNLYRQLKGQPTIKFAENLLSPSKNAPTRPTDQGGQEENKMRRSIEDTFNSAVRGFTEGVDDSGVEPVRIQVVPADNPETSASARPMYSEGVGDEMFLQDGRINKETMATLLSRGYSLPTAEELKSMGFGVYTDGQGRVIGYQKPDGSNVQWEYP